MLEPRSLLVLAFASLLTLAGCAGDDDDVAPPAEDDLTAAAARYECTSPEISKISFHIQGTKMELDRALEDANNGPAHGELDPNFRPTNPANRNFVAYKGFPELDDPHDPGSVTLLIDRKLLRRAATGPAKLRFVSEHSGFSEFQYACTKQ
jgi:hypothetical protein